jgi:hypothetical protein
MSVSRLLVSLIAVAVLAACQSTPQTEPSALELASACTGGSVKVCAKDFSTEPFECGCVDETHVRPLWNR